MPTSAPDGLPRFRFRVGLPRFYVGFGLNFGLEFRVWG